jgi:hypothetical protein
LGISKSRRLSREDLSLSLGTIAFPIHVWAIINILIIFPAWLLRLSTWELAGVISYPLVDAILESCLFWVMFLVLGLVLPRKWLADKFVPLSSTLAWLLAGWAVYIHLNFERILQWGPMQIFPTLFLVILSFGLVYWVVRRYGRLQGWIKKIAQRLVVLTYFYMVFDLLGLAVVIIRNL